MRRPLVYPEPREADRRATRRSFALSRAKRGAGLLAARHIPRGFRFTATACGLKKKPGALDLALLVSDAPASAAAVFTTNRVQAAPVRLSREHLRRSRGRIRAIVVNAGNANCATGAAGMRASQATAAAAAREFGCRPEQVLVCSTGVIGVPLPVERILGALPGLGRGGAATPAAFAGVARAIMTTDTRPKLAAAACRIGGRTVRLLGCAKGAGMIAPRMATMLAFLVTDAAIAPPLLQRALREAAGRTFNRITVDGDTSTNDTVILLANGVARHSPLGTRHSRDYRRFLAALENVCRSLALAIVADGEGAQRVVEITVQGAASERAAEQVARTIANSPLVKTALAGADPNWGRILAAAGRAGVPFDPERATVWMAGIKVYARGRALPFDERAAHGKLLASYVPVAVDLGGEIGKRKMENGKRASRPARHSSLGTRHSVRIWTCDFTAAYVDINASYRT
jgi:glutamate N-acetyltransferase/amino-acid N-acetyltransferase